MVATIKVLKRKDASSLIVAIVIAQILGLFLSAITSDLAGRVSGFGGPEGSFGTWKGMYFQPILWVVLQLIALEILIWVYVFARSLVAKKRK